MSEITEEQYRKLKRDVEDAKAEADRAQGALDQLLVRLKDEFDCDNLKEAKTKLAALKNERNVAQVAFEDSMADYQKRWKGD